jgi:EAL domain-containing protein (putative c-di-GMP-specific phosphodiesterase class I)
MIHPLTIPPAEQNIFPYFQPIIAANQRSVAGYEILGRYKDQDHAVLSLGSYFHHETIHVEEKCLIDRWVRTKALDVLKLSSTKDSLYFFNISPDIFTFEEDCFFYDQLLNIFQINRALQPGQIVLEITETDYSINESTFLKRLIKYRNLGCKIAVDDFGRGFSNLERVALLKPHILKIDLPIVQKSVESQSHRDILHALSILSQRIGAQLLFEGIETLELLEIAWKHGAQYYQGFLFAKPSPHLIKDIECLHLFQDQLGKMIQKEIYHLQKKYSFEEELNQIVRQNLPDIRSYQNYDQYLEHICTRLPIHCFRIYICNRLGFQLSGNHFRDEPYSWIIQKNDSDKNWSWRPYFLKNIVSMEINQKGFLSDIYTDIETNEHILTFSFPLQKNIYLFIDIKL